MEKFVLENGTRTGFKTVLFNDTPVNLLGVIIMGFWDFRLLKIALSKSRIDCTDV